MVLFYFLNDFIYLFLERGEGRKKEKERNIPMQEKQWSVASHMLSTGDLAHNPGMCPDQELNQWPFTLQDDAQPLSHTCQGSIWFF